MIIIGRSYRASELASPAFDNHGSSVHVCVCAFVLVCDQHQQVVLLQGL